LNLYSCLRIEKRIIDILSIFWPVPLRFALCYRGNGQILIRRSSDQILVVQAPLTVPQRQVSPSLLPPTPQYFIVTLPMQAFARSYDEVHKVPRAPQHQLFTCPELWLTLYQPLIILPMKPIWHFVPGKSVLLTVNTKLGDKTFFSFLFSAREKGNTRSSSVGRRFKE
jgi:hypothetical protein